MPYFSTYLGHISREETRCHISIRQMRDRMKKIRNPALFVPEPQCMRSSLLPFDDFCQCSWLIVHPRHHTADVDELPADMMSFRAGIANLFAPSKKESIFTGIMNMPMKHIAVFIIISPMKRDEVMAHNYMLAAVGDFLYRCDILKIPFGGLTEFSGIMLPRIRTFPPLSLSRKAGHCDSFA